jgi:hypothetical protein
MARIPKPRPFATLTDENGQVRSLTFMEGMFWALRKQEAYEQRWNIRRAFIDYTDLVREAKGAVWDGFGPDYENEFVQGAYSVRDRVCVAKCESVVIHQEEARREERAVEEQKKIAQAKKDAAEAWAEATTQITTELQRETTSQPA